MVLRKFILGAAAVALTASTAVADGLDGAVTQGAGLDAILAGPTGTFGGLSTTAIVAAGTGVVFLGTVIAVTGDDDGDSTNGTPGTPTAE